MTSFKVFQNKSESKSTYPFLLNVQNELFENLNTRLVIPLVLEKDLGKKGIKFLNPQINIDKNIYLVLTQQMAAIPKMYLGNEINSVKIEREMVLGAIDFLITGF